MQHIRRTRRDSVVGDYLPPFGLVIKGAIIGYVLLILVNSLLAFVFLSGPPLYWWLFADDIFATLGIMVIMTLIGIVLYIQWVSFRQR